MPTNQYLSRKKGDWQPAHGRIMNNLCFDQTKQNQNDPKKNFHPGGKSG